MPYSNGGSLRAEKKLVVLGSLALPAGARDRALLGKRILLNGIASGVLIGMRIRKARNKEFPQIVALAKKYSLDYPGMDKDDFLVAEEKRRIIGICGIKKHGDWGELCSLGVDEDYRKRGVGGRLVSRVIKEVRSDIFLATLIPEFFVKFGFEKAAYIPSFMVKDSEWCQGCQQELCTVMVRKHGKSNKASSFSGI